MKLRKKPRCKDNFRSLPAAGEALLARGIAAQQNGALELAISCLARVVRLNPQHVVAIHELGLAYSMHGDVAQAEKYLRLAVTLAPEMASAHYNLGNLLISQGQVVAALACHQEAARLDPDDSDVLTNIGVTFYELGQVDRAVEYFQKALAVNPASPQLHSTLVSALHYVDSATSAVIFDYAKQWWRAHGRPLYRKIMHANTPSATRRLKIGYISPDFRDHSIYYFISPLLQAHDRSQFEIFCYSDVSQPDWATTEIKALSDNWRDITHATDGAVSIAIERDGIDLLIDLAGHMTGNRLLVFAQKPAPIQISWLGYPGTTGLPTIDYRLVDEVTDPAGGGDCWHSEQLLRLPACFLCYQPPAESLEPGPSPYARSGVFTFGSFNNPAKLNTTVLAAWASIMCELPKSHLLLKGKHLNDLGVQGSVLEALTGRGVDATRISFSPHLPTRRDHLNLYNKVDLCLDTFPYNGTTTTLEALWMGVPVLTRRGERHAGRVGASILTTLGSTELITDNTQAYIEAACRLGSEPLALRPRGLDLRRQLLASSICAPRLFAKRVEFFYRGAWQQWCKSLGSRPSQALSLNPP